MNVLRTASLKLVGCECALSKTIEVISCGSPCDYRSSQVTSNPHLVPQERDPVPDVPGWTGESEPNFLDIALEESSDSSEDEEDEWEEVSCTANGTVADQPLVTAPSRFTLPSDEKRSELLTLEVIEDWQPSSLPSASHTDDPRAGLREATDLRLAQEPAGEEDDSFEADLKLEAELEEALAELNTPPSPPRQQGSPNPNATTKAANAPSPTRLKLEAIEERQHAHASTKGNGKSAVRRSTEHSYDTVKRVDPRPVSSVTEDPRTREPKGLSQGKSAEPARPKEGSITLPRPLPRRDHTGSPSSAPNSSLHPPTQAASNPSSLLFTSRSFSQHAQNLHKRKTEDTARRFRERYGGVVEHPRRTDAGSVPAPVPTQPLDPSRGAHPTNKRQVRKNAGGKRITKAQACAEEVLKICRSTKSYIVDMAAIRQRLAPTIPVPQGPTPSTQSATRSSSDRLGKTIPAVAGQGTSRIQPPVQDPVPIPRLPSQVPPTPLGSVPKGLRFTKKRKLPPEPGEIVIERAVGKATLSDLDTPRPRLVSTDRDGGPSTTEMSKRRRVNPGRIPEGPPSRLGRP